MFKKADIILALIIVITGIASSIFLTFGDDSKGTKAIVHVDNKVYGTYSLLEDREVVIKDQNHINKITISKGKISMNFSNCHSQDCVKQGEIHSPSQSIICLPHKVVVEITSDNNEFDSISN
ncbi:MAG: NusG domain II-containing protein [Anaerovoracaceae bacterium]